MSAHKVKQIEQGAIVLANDLASGRTVYLSADGQWAAHQKHALVVVSDEQAQSALDQAAVAESNNRVVGSYLVATNEAGVPVHIRERLRTLGPSIDYLATRSSVPEQQLRAAS